LTFAISCGSIITVVVPRGTTPRAWKRHHSIAVPDVAQLVLT